MEKHFCGDVWRSKGDSVWTGANWSEIGGKMGGDGNEICMNRWGWVWFLSARRSLGETRLAVVRHRTSYGPPLHDVVADRTPPPTLRFNFRSCLLSVRSDVYNHCPRSYIVSSRLDEIDTRLSPRVLYLGYCVRTFRQSVSVFVIFDRSTNVNLIVALVRRRSSMNDNRLT